MSTDRAALVLGIESSCDETAVALYHTQRGLLAEVLHSQIDLHALYGGVVPELASRDHVRRLPGLLTQVCAQAAVELRDLDAIAYTAGPGLVGALLAGSALAAGLAQGLGKPLIPIHHMEGHLLAPLISDRDLEFPFVALLVSGGHTLLVACHSLGQYELLGQSLDDAAGEAFDKTAQLLGLPYPGGPALSALAASGTAGRFPLPRPLTKQRGLDFSFSGLKTAVANQVAKSAGPQDFADLAADFELAVVDTLLKKCRWALQDSGMQRLLIAGGVAANQPLRRALQQLCDEQSAQFFVPAPALCTDNAAMIAHVGALRVDDAQTSGAPVRARWPLAELRMPGVAA
ncbi:MAG: tRNA (adenosine(37)-N6)-threonylcarbamoyltransferase complex transferase subunit TsaD [Oceanococcus sp.]